ncbi:hypothetical protein GUY44_28520 [Pimelobacter simplex]|uniref:Group B surface immunogenic protein n=1 Tax=Nocardioides simplex TaxID=2045 RepID=A0A0C5XMA7_NOCSI|nr:hypothetical protein [Pimelobacter simplex]AJR18592.1 Group B surface immunogenic protein [Pimelobacter simplex]MCG8154448.1 hypothetical protein [Pimelobacter simplex]GEB16446.1 hypothetical protein NSI01_47610 [Pimelobacter simplex]SFM37188.1 hypothetical protein SAMN05421671_1557 [Pimelobacter simplex]
MATSHKRETARRTPRAALLAGSLAVLATTAVVSTGVLGSSAPPADVLAVDRAKAATGSLDEAAPREIPVISRSADRSADAVGTRLDRMLATPAVTKAVKNADTRRWTTAPLNLWSRPDKRGKQVGELEEGDKVVLTGRRYADRAEVVVDGKARWVTDGYFSDEKPATLGGTCTNGTTVPSAVSASIKKVHEAVCAAFPDVSVYGTFRGASISGDHETGRAVDIMISGARGWQIAEFVRENYAALGVSYIIYSQKIWSVERSGEGWRGMPNRGSATANHFDHVHVSVY